MNLCAYSVKDIKAGVYMQPFYCRHEAEAVRSLNRAVNDPNSTLSIYPADFELHKLGEWNDFSGQFKNLETPAFIMNAVQARDLNRSGHIVNTSESDEK